MSARDDYPYLMKLLRKWSLGGELSRVLDEIDSLRAEVDELHQRLYDATYHS